MAGQIPQSFINDLLGRVDIVGLIGERVPLKKAGKDYQARCPFHDEKTPSFTVSQDKQFYYCFGCSASGTALTFLMEYERLPFVESVEALAARVGVEVPRERSGRPQRDNSGLYEIMQRAERYFRRQLKGSKQAVDYLRSRGVTGAVAGEFGIGFAPDSWNALQEALASGSQGTGLLLEAGLVSRNEQGNVYDRFRGRILFPIRDIRGRVIGFGGRLLGDGDGPKYLNSPETPIFHKGNELYGIFEARKSVRNLSRFIVVEGYMDVIALAQCGVPNAVATLGTASGENHFRELYRHVDEVICCFDGDRAGRQAAWRALENALPALSEGRRLKFMLLPGGEDPDTLVRKEGAEGFLARLDEALPAIEYLFDELESGFDLEAIDDRATLVSLARPYVDRVPEGSLKDLMRQRVGELTGLRPERASLGAGTSNRKPGATAQRGMHRLEQHLLAMLLRRPGLHGVLNAGQTERLQALDGRDGGDLLRDVLKYLANHPDAEPGQILGRWSGDPQHDELSSLYRARIPLLAEVAPTAEQEAKEFAETVDRLIDVARKQHRRRQHDELRQDPSLDRLREFWLKNPESDR